MRVILIAILIGVLVVAGLLAERTIHERRREREEQAAAKLTSEIKTAHVEAAALAELMLVWRMDHTDSQRDPADWLGALAAAEYKFEATDPWGHPYRLGDREMGNGGQLTCAASDGPDGQPFTADDIVETWRS